MPTSSSSNIDIAFIKNNIGSSGFIPPNALRLHYEDGSPFVIADAEVYEKPYKPCYFFIINRDGELVVDISITSSEIYNYAKIAGTLTIGAQLSGYLSTFAKVTKHEYECIEEDYVIYDVKLEQKFSSITKHIINVIEGREETASETVDNFLSELFDDKLKPHPSEVSKKTSTPETSQFITTENNQKQFKIDDIIEKINENFEPEEKVSENIETLNKITKIYEMINNTLKINDVMYIYDANVLLNYSNNIMLLTQFLYKSSESTPKYDEIIETIITNILSNSKLNSDITKFRSLVREEYFSFLESTNDDDNVEIMKLADHSKESMETLEKFYQEYFKIYNIFKKDKMFNQNGTPLFKKYPHLYTDFIAYYLSLVYYVKYIYYTTVFDLNSILNFDENDVDTNTINTYMKNEVVFYTDLDFVIQNFGHKISSSSQQRIVEIKTNLTKLGMSIQKFSTDLIESNFGKI